MKSLVDIVGDFLKFESLGNIDYKDPDNIIIHGIDSAKTSPDSDTIYVIVTNNKKDYVIEAINNTRNKYKPVLRSNEPIFLSYGINLIHPLVNTLRELKVDDNKTYVIYGELPFDDVVKLQQEFGNNYIIETMYRVIANKITGRYGSKERIPNLSEPFINKYSCECKNIVGKMNEGQVCSKCNTEVKFREYDMNSMVDMVDKLLEHRLIHFQEMVEETNDIIISGIHFVITSTILKKKFAMINKNEKDHAMRAMNRSINNIRPVLEDGKSIYLYFGLNSFTPLVETLNELKLENTDVIIISGVLDDNQLLTLIEKFSDKYIIEYK